MARLTEQSHKVLQRMAMQYGESHQDLLDAAIDALQRKRFFEEAHRAYAELRSDPTASAALDAERSALDGALGDGTVR